MLARQVQLVFQDPFSSLNPRLTVAAALGEVLAVHHLVAGRAERRARVDELLGMVALAPRFAARYPHELSGGQAQRVAIARALAVQPQALVLDEPTSALDVSVRAEVVNLLTRLQDELGLSYVFISHDLAMVRHISDVICVMYLGKVVESGPYEAVLGAPLHPYTRALSEAVPLPDPEVEASRRKSTAGEALVLGAETPGGCPYNPRCPLAEEVCRAQVPALLELRAEALCGVPRRRPGDRSEVRRLEDPGEENLSPLLARARQDFLRGTGLDYNPFVHEHQAVAYLPCETDLVGYHDHRHAVVGQRPHHVQHVTDQLRVER